MDNEDPSGLSWLSKAWGAVKSAVSTVVKTVSKAVVKVVDTVKKVVSSATKSVVKAVTPSASKTYSAVSYAVMPVMQKTTTSTIVPIGQRISAQTTSVAATNSENPSADDSQNQQYPGSTHTDDYVNPKEVPNPESGYQAPRKSPKSTDKYGRVKPPSGKGWGWPANDGGVWVPDNDQDGGPGWTEQYPNGSHNHHYPDGHVRVHTFAFDPSAFADALAALLIFAVVVAVVVVIIASGGYGALAFLAL